MTPRKKSNFRWRENEIKKRERLVEIMILISGLLIAHIEAEFLKSGVSFFTFFLLVAIIYFVSISRTSEYMHTLADYFAFLTAFTFSIFLAFFIDMQTPARNEDIPLILIALFFTTFLGLMTPESSSFLDNISQYISKKTEKNRLLKILIFVISIVSVFVVYFYTLFR